MSARVVGPYKDVGSIGAVQLKELWARTMGRRNAPLILSPEDESEWRYDYMALAGLGLDLWQTFRYLYLEQPTFDQFERWIVASSGGAVDPHRVEIVNGFIAGVPEDEPHRPIVPVFGPDDLAHWDEHGYVTLHDAVSPDACAAAAAAIWEYLGMDPADPETWYRNRREIMTQVFDHPAIWANRCAPRVRDAFAQLWGRADLSMQVESCGMNPPERPGWSYPGPFLHFDMDVVVPFPFGVQGILYLTDTAENQGALTLIPGFHRRIEAWVRSLPPDAHASHEPLRPLGETVHVPGRAGDLILWHHALPHSASPNRAALPRLVQYIRMFPRRWD